MGFGVFLVYYGFFFLVFGSLFCGGLVGIFGGFVEVSLNVFGRFSLVGVGWG